MNKTLSALLWAAFFPLTMGVVAAAFSDVSVEHQNQAAIDLLGNRAIIGGYEDGTFRPGRNINRAELSKILVESVAGTPNANVFNNCFPDVGVEWFARYVCYAKSEGWVSGYPDGTFQPAQNVKDVEALKMILSTRGIKANNESEDPFTDVAIGQWFAPYVSTAKRLNMLEEGGYYYSPGKLMKRGGIAELIYRAIVLQESNATRFSLEIAARHKSAQSPNNPTPLPPEPEEEPEHNTSPYTDRVYQHNKNESRLRFTGYRDGEAQHAGNFNTFGFTLTFDENNPGDLEFADLSMTIDIFTMTTDSSALTSVLLGGEFFDADSYPQAYFDSSSIVKTSDNTYQVTGELLLKGRRSQIQFDMFAVTDTQLELRHDLDRLLFDVGSASDGIDQLVPIEALILLE